MLEQLLHVAIADAWIACYFKTELNLENSTDYSQKVALFCIELHNLT